MLLEETRAACRLKAHQREGAGWPGAPAEPRRGSQHRAVGGVQRAEPPAVTETEKAAASAPAPPSHHLHLRPKLPTLYP